MIYATTAAVASAAAVAATVAVTGYGAEVQTR
jgi:hypothetical protein